MKDWDSEVADLYRNKKVLITGGFGFLGLNLVRGLRRMPAEVRVLSRSWAPENRFLRSAEDIEFHKGDIRDETVVATAVRGADVILHMAGASGPTASNLSPFEHQDVNTRGQLVLLEACRNLAPEARIVFPSSRLVYAPHAPLPVAETAPTSPLSLYGVQKLAGEHYLHVYHRLYSLPITILRITNPYGPFQRQEQNRYGIVNWFVHRAMHRDVIPIFGAGEQLRDLVHVQDVVKALLKVAVDDRTIGGTYNVGSGRGASLLAVAQLIVRCAGKGVIEHREWPAEAAKVETGDFVADIQLIQRTVGWQPDIPLEAGIEMEVRNYPQTIDARA
jgi:nucleoside-diphosphate-sugar epimerase